METYTNNLGLGITLRVKDYTKDLQHNLKTVLKQACVPVLVEDLGKPQSLPYQYIKIIKNYIDNRGAKTAPWKYYVRFRGQKNFSITKGITYKKVFSSGFRYGSANKLVYPVSPITFIRRLSRRLPKSNQGALYDTGSMYNSLKMTPPNVSGAGYSIRIGVKTNKIKNFMENEKERPLIEPAYQELQQSAFIEKFNARVAQNMATKSNSYIKGLKKNAI